MKFCQSAFALILGLPFIAQAATPAAAVRSAALVQIHRSVDPDFTKHVFNNQGQVLLEGFDGKDFFIERYSPNQGWKNFGAISYDTQTYLSDAGEVITTAASIIQPGNTGLFRRDGETAQEVLSVSQLVAAGAGAQGEVAACTATELRVAQRSGQQTSVAFPAGITPNGLMLLGDGTALISYSDSDGAAHYLAIRGETLSYIDSAVLPGEAIIVGVWHSQAVFYLTGGNKRILYRSDLVTPYTEYSPALAAYSSNASLDILAATESGYILARDYASAQGALLVVLPSGKVRRINCLFNNSTRATFGDSPRPLINESGEILVPVANLDNFGKAQRWGILDLNKTGDGDFCPRLSAVLDQKCRRASSVSSPLAQGSICRVQVKVKDSQGHPLRNKRVVVRDLGQLQNGADGGWFPGPYRVIASAYTNARGSVLVPFHASRGYRGVEVVAPYCDSRWRSASASFTLAAQ